MSEMKKEQTEVVKLVKGIHPEVKGNYDAMLKLMANVNPNVVNMALEENEKRVMYLQLLAHSVEQSCHRLIEVIDEPNLILELSVFHRDVTEFCQSWLMKDDFTHFEPIQENQSRYFYEKWKMIVNEMKRQSALIQ